MPTGISWTDETWNPTKGCQQVSPGCRNCYAKHQAARIVRMAKGKPSKYDSLVKLGPHGDPCWTGEGLFDPEALALPLTWKAPRRIFVDSMSDLFYDVFTNDQIAAVFGVMAACPQHTFQVLTKRPKRMREWFAWANPIGLALLSRDPRLPVPRVMIEDAAMAALDGVVYGIPSWRDHRWPLPNVQLGISAENQDAADERIPDLLATPAAVRILSNEPLIGEIDLDRPRCDDRHHGQSEWVIADDGTPWCNECDAERSYGHWLHPDGGIDLVIAGCESGAEPRPCEVSWVRLQRDQCKEAGVPFFLKQANDATPEITTGPGSRRKRGGLIELPYLDGVQHADLGSTASVPLNRR